MDGTLTVSVEVELGWGVHDLGDYSHLSSDGEREREYLRRFLELCDRYRIPVSFDVVGHLFLDECTGSHATDAYPDGWFDADPGTDADRSGLFYAPDMVSNIDSADVDHEICTHTFSHALFNEFSEEAADVELRRAQEIHLRELGQETESLVPPRHHDPPREPLRSNGIEIVRLGEQAGKSSKVARWWELLGGRIPTHEPTLRDGIVETYCTTNPTLTAPALPRGAKTPHRLFSPIPEPIRKRLYLRALRRSLQNAIDEGSTLHLWCHLFDLSNEPQIELIEAFFRSVDATRDDVDILTMDELNERVRATQ